MRLTLVTETFPPEVNGVAKTLGRWVEEFQRRGHAVDVIRPAQARERLADDGIPALAVPFYPQVRVGLALPHQLRSRLRKGRADLVHIATEGPLGLAALLAAEQLRLPVASSFHTNFDHYMAHYGLAGWEWSGRTYLRWFHNRTDVTLVPSRATQERLRLAGFERVELWSRGVDGELFNPRRRDAAFRAELGIGDAELLLLFVGRLAWEKNLETLLAAFAELRNRLAESGPKAKLALVGEGPLLNSLRDRSLPDVLFPGAVHGLELARWFASADVFAFPSRSETFGNAILEAQASGLPVVAFAYDATRERIESGVDGILLEKDEELASALLALSRDPERRRRLGQAARLTAERQTWRPIFDSLERHYLRLVAAKRRRRPATGDAAGAPPVGAALTPACSDPPAA